MKAKLALMQGSSFKLFNANAATLLDSLKAGASGYSGVMTNFHAALYTWLCRNWKTQSARAEGLQDYLGTASLIEGQLYPVNAMYALALEGLPIHLASRRADSDAFGEGMRREVEQFMRLSHRISADYAR
jgi:4-hydroxy-tetrahydrodipicolinate synthase